MVLVNSSGTLILTMWMGSIMTDILGNNLSVTQISHLYADTWVKRKTVPNWTEPHRNTHRAPTCSISLLPQRAAGVMSHIQPHRVYHAPSLSDTLLTISPCLSGCNRSDAHFHKQMSGLSKLTHHRCCIFLCISWPLMCIKLCHQFY